jgi:5-(carboxyamino)imidazole ribonucleotide synthase
MIRLGILGGGQLAQMTTQAAVSLGIETAIFERKPDSPASRLTHHNVVGDWEDDSLIRTFADLSDVVTLENEFVDASVLNRLQALSLPVYPTAHTLRIIQDKLRQKRAMETAGLPLPPFREITSQDDVVTAAESLGWPLVLKARREGYDGYGNATLHSTDDISAAWDKLGVEQGRELLVEGFVPFVRELAVMVLRGRDGEIRTYPVVETVQQNHICHVVRAPAAISGAVKQRAIDIATQAVETVAGVGVFGVELFELEDGTVLYNEMAPRPHNSGHYTIEACETSQFENHIRAVLGWPLGSTAMVKPAAVMVNTLGSTQGTAAADAAREALGMAGAHIHIYAKRDVRPGRKMGHVTALGTTLEEAEATARQAATLVNL